MNIYIDLYEYLKSADIEAQNLSFGNPDYVFNLTYEEFCAQIEPFGTTGAWNKGLHLSDWDKNKKSKALKDYHERNPGANLGRKQTQNYYEKKCKSYKITYPNGEERVINNLIQFCRDNGLNQGNMCSVAAGRLKHHKGFHCTKILD